MYPFVNISPADLEAINDDLGKLEGRQKQCFSFRFSFSDLVIYKIMCDNGLWVVCDGQFRTEYDRE